MRRVFGAAAAVLLAGCSHLPFQLSDAARPAPNVRGPYDVLITDAVIYDGSGGTPYRGEVGIDGDRIAYVGPRAPSPGAVQVDVDGKAVSPGFVNVLSHAREELLHDGRAMSDVLQGVTTEINSEVSYAPLNDRLRRELIAGQGDIKFDAPWTTLGQYLEQVERSGVSVNVAALVGAAQVRDYVIGSEDVDPTPAQLDQMKTLIREAMEEGALGATSALIYAPASYAETPELVALASESARCGGLFAAHIRGEGDRLLTALDEMFEIARSSGGPVHVHHLKQAGRENWGLLDPAIARIEGARAAGLKVSVDMYTYPAGATGLDAAMPTWVQAGGYEAWKKRLQDPKIRARVVAEMRAKPVGWESLMQGAGADGMLLVGFKNPALKPLTGKTLAEVARLRGVSPEEAAIDLVVEDGSRVGTVYFLMSEDNVRRQTALPWMTFGSDGSADAAEGPFLLYNPHPRAYGNFARLFGKYVREEKALTLEEAVRRTTAYPADVFGIEGRGRLRPGDFADVVVFDPATIRDRATFDKPHQYAEGVAHVWVNGVQVVKDGAHTGAKPGRAVRGPAWTGAGEGGCRASAADW